MSDNNIHTLVNKICEGRSCRLCPIDGYCTDALRAKKYEGAEYWENQIRIEYEQLFGKDFELDEAEIMSLLDE